MKLRMETLLALTFLLVGTSSASAQKTRPISANGKPLTFQVTGVSVTREPQSIEQMELILTGPLPLVDSTYRGPVQSAYNYKSIPLAPYESFVIVTFSISNVKRQLNLSTGDVKLIDGWGYVHQRLGSRSYMNAKLNAWSSWDEILDPKRQNLSEWIFQIPTETVSGATIQFQNATYPLPAMPMQEIHDAAQNGDLAKVQALLKDNPALVSTKAANYSGGTPLHVAAGWGHKEVAQLLLDNKAVVDAKNNNGYTPLYVAARAGYKDVVELLLANGADVNAKDDDGQTPLGAVLSMISKHPLPGQEGVAELLRQHGGHE